MTMRPILRRVLMAELLEEQTAPPTMAVQGIIGSRRKQQMPMLDDMVERVGDAIKYALLKSDAQIDSISGEALNDAALAAVEALHTYLSEGDFFWMECQECGVGRKIDDMLKQKEAADAR